MPLPPGREMPRRDVALVETLALRARGEEKKGAPEISHRMKTRDALLTLALDPKRLGALDRRVAVEGWCLRDPR